jgi:hypothetical protein
MSGVQTRSGQIAEKCRNLHFTAPTRISQHSETDLTSVEASSILQRFLIHRSILPLQLLDGLLFFSGRQIRLDFVILVRYSRSWKLKSSLTQPFYFISSDQHSTFLYFKMKLQRFLCISEMLTIRLLPFSRNTHSLIVCHFIRRVERSCSSAGSSRRTEA